MTGTQRPRLVGAQRHFARNLVDAIGALTAEDRAAGREWWPGAIAEVNNLAIRFGVRYETVAYAAAALSPGIPWEGTLETLELLLTANRDGATEMPTGSGHLTFGYAPRRKAWAIITEPSGPNRSKVYDLCRGPKVEAIAGILLEADPDAVPVDRHVTRAATGVDIAQVSPGDMGRIAEAMRVIADALGERPCDLQAALWIAGTRASRRIRAERSARTRRDTRPVTSSR